MHCSSEDVEQKLALQSAVILGSTSTTARLDPQEYCAGVCGRVPLMCGACQRLVKFLIYGGDTIDPLGTSNHAQNARTLASF